uniref:Ig-like domain-containing protein n=1 Tax=Chrysemys picta bellii TaxID=8478 RepID=A0A8C3FYU1_CHRPI
PPPSQPALPSGMGQTQLTSAQRLSPGSALGVWCWSTTSRSWARLSLRNPLPTCPQICPTKCPLHLAGAELVSRQSAWAYPFVIQASIGCELHPNGTSQQFCDAAVNGEDFISFNVDVGTWVAQHWRKLALNSRDFLNQDKSTIAMAQFLLRTTCVNELKSFAQYGRESLARQVPEAQTESSPLPPGAPAPVLLVCRVTGFYPRPICVAWLQDGEEVGPGERLNSSEILPNADLTYQLRSSLAVGPGAGHSYACRVQHSSLGGRSLLIPWGRCTSPGGRVVVSGGFSCTSQAGQGPGSGTGERKAEWVCGVCGDGSGEQGGGAEGNGTGLHRRSRVGAEGRGNGMG